MFKQMHTIAIVTFAVIDLLTMVNLDDKPKNSKHTGATVAAEQAMPVPIPMPPRSTIEIDRLAPIVLDECNDGELLNEFTPHTVMRVVIVRVLDGDTYVAERTQRFKIRLSDADTWESRHVQRTGSDEITDEEILRGLKAKKEVAELLASGEVYAITTPGEQGEDTLRDNFGRVLARVYVRRKGDRDWETVSVGQWLRQHGHARQ